MIEAFVLNRERVLARLGGDEEIFALVLDTYLRDLDTNCASLAAALASGDPTVVRREAHTVKGLLATYGDEAGAAAALAVERQVRDGQVAGLGGAVAGLLTRLRDVAAVLAVARQAG